MRGYCLQEEKLLLLLAVESKSDEILLIQLLLDIIVCQL